MLCICDCDAFADTRRPLFFGRPDLVLGYIESYVQRYSLQRQANEALQIAILWPTLLRMGAHISLPRPLHTCDWLGGEVDPVMEETGFRELMALGHAASLAAVLAAPLSLQSQVFDHLALLTSKRSTWQVQRTAIDGAVAWLETQLSAPGTGWDFLLRHQFGISPSFLYLTGLSNQCLPWRSLVHALDFPRRRLPCHLRLMQAFWTSSSLSCVLPWQTPWTPAFEVQDRILSASAPTLLRLLLLRVLGYDGGERREPLQALLDRPGLESTLVRPADLERLRVLEVHGLLVAALSPRRRGPPTFAAYDDFDGDGGSSDFGTALHSQP